jgi:bifunctional DNase/RNase
MELVAIRMEVPANTPVMILREREGRRRVLPIYIGSSEAAAIHYAIEGIVAPRPLTHDLFQNVIADLGATLTRVIVTEIRDETYFAELHLDLGGQAHTVSSRPSDAVALAVRSQSPIFASAAVLDAAGTEAALDVEPDADDADSLVAEFADFIEQISPEDFAG